MKNYSATMVKLRERSMLSQGWTKNFRKGAQCIKIHEHFETIFRPRLPNSERSYKEAE